MSLQPLTAKKSEQWGKAEQYAKICSSWQCVVKGRENIHIRVPYQSGNTKTNLEQEGIICIWQASCL